MNPPLLYYIGQIERGEKNVALLNLAKIADALDVSIIQLFSYDNEGSELTKADVDISEIVTMLRRSNPKEKRLIRIVLREIVNGEDSK